MNTTTPFDGWRMVAVAFTVATFGWGLGFYGPPVYLEAVVSARGWPVATVSGAVTLHFLAGVAVVANLPGLHRRFGVPAVTFGGAVLLAVGVLGWAVAQAPWQLYAATLLSGAGWVTMGAAAVNAIVAPWFVARRPAALASAYNGASLGGVVFSPLWVALIGLMGFPVAALLLGGLMLLVIGWLAWAWLGRTPAGSGQLPDGGAVAGAARVNDAPPMPGSPWRDWAFLTLVAGFALALFAQIGLIAHMVSLLVPALGTQGAGLAAGLSTAAAILGRTLVGWWMLAGADRRMIACISLAVQALGGVCLVFAGGAAWPLLLGVVLIGLGIGNATSLPPLIAQTEFTPAQSGRVVALSVAAAQFAYSFAPGVFGVLRAVAPDAAVFGLAMAVQAAAVVAYLLGRGAWWRR